MWPSACLLATDSCSQLPLDTHGFTYTYANTHIHFRYRPVHKHTHTHTAHIWFCFTNGVASDLTTPYKACLVPLILSWRMRAHTKTHTHTALIDYTAWAEGMTQEEWACALQTIWIQERKDLKWNRKGWFSFSTKENWNLFESVFVPSVENWEQKKSL